jgi:membrane protein DedA with SNARE-associated domain
MDPAALISTYGMIAVIVILFLDILGVPLPAQITLLLSGMALADGTFHPIGIFSAIMGAHISGSTLAYFLGRAYGLGFVLKIGSYVGLRKDKFEELQHKFARYDYWIIFIGKFIPFVCVWLLYLAGIAKVHFGRFFVINFVSAAIWVALNLVAGLYLGETLIALDFHWIPFLKSFGIPLVIISAIIYWVVVRRQKQS